MWAGYKLRLVEVLRAGVAEALEEDASYDHLLALVAELAGRRQEELAGAAGSPRLPKKVIKENSELKRTVRELEERLPKRGQRGWRSTVTGRWICPGG